MRRLARPLAAILLALTLAPVAGFADDTEAAIQYLLQSIGESGCTFIRNGKSHSAEDAEAHLRMKYNRGRKYAGTAEKFIERLATASSWTNEPYSIRCGDAPETPTGEWLKAKLEQYRAAAAAASESS